MVHGFKLKLVGCSFQKFQNIPKKGDAVFLKLEPKNEFDENAIAVYNEQREKIGYIGTDKTVSTGNRKNGCIDNVDLHIIANTSDVNLNDKNSYIAILSKFKDYFGFIDLTLDV